MNTPAKNSVLDFLKTPADTSRQPKSHRDTSPLNNSHYIKSNFINNMMNKANEQKNYQSFDNLYKQEPPLYRPHQNVITPVFAENRGYLARPSVNDNMMDFFQSSKSGALSERIDFSPINHYKDHSNYDERCLGMRKGSSSEAYLNAIKALQEKVGYFSDKVKQLESENGFLKNLQEEQRVERGREERQFQDSTFNILEKLENLGDENLALKNENKELMDNNQGLGKENVKLTEDKKKLKKKLVAMKSEVKLQQDVIADLEKKLQKAQISAEDYGQKAKSLEEQLQEEVRNLRREKEGLEFKAGNLSEIVKKQENELAQGKKIYNQHLENLALTNEALVHDNQQLKDHYRQEIGEIGAELEMIQEGNAQKIGEYEEEMEELRKNNDKLRELLKIKNEEIQGLKTRNKEEEMKSELRESLNTVRARLSVMRTHQSPIKTEGDSPKVSSSVLTSFAREKNSYGNKDQTPDDLYRQAKRILASQGDEASQVRGKRSMSSAQSSPERRELEYSKVTTKSNLSQRPKYNKTEESMTSHSKTTAESRPYWKDRDASVSSGEDNMVYISSSHELKSREARKEAKYYAHVMRTSYRDQSPDQSSYETPNTRSTLQENRSGEKKGNMKSNYGTFGHDDKGIHQLFYSNDDGYEQKEVFESWRDNEQPSQKSKAQKSFFDVIQSGK